MNCHFQFEAYDRGSDELFQIFDLFAFQQNSVVRGPVGGCRVVVQLPPLFLAVAAAHLRVPAFSVWREKC